MVNNYMSRRFWAMPAFDPHSHWERRWEWCKQFPKFMGIDAPWKPNVHRGEHGNE